MGFESEREGVIPTGYESERVAGIDHDARHGDRDSYGHAFQIPRETNQRPLPADLVQSA